jgi:FtsZ-binding cell division protein ZapB
MLPSKQLYIPGYTLILKKNATIKVLQADIEDLKIEKNAIIKSLQIEIENLKKRLHNAKHINRFIEICLECGHDINFQNSNLACNDRHKLY